MKVDQETIKKVLALFDPEDIPYIKSDALLVLVMEPEELSSEEHLERPKMKRLGEKNDRSRK